MGGEGLLGKWMWWCMGGGGGYNYRFSRIMITMEIGYRLDI